MNDLFDFIIGYASWAELESTEKYLSVCVEATEEYNKQNKTEYDFHDYIEGYFMWKDESWRT